VAEEIWTIWPGLPDEGAAEAREEPRTTKADAADAMLKIIVKNERECVCVRERVCGKET